MQWLYSVFPNTLHLSVYYFSSWLRGSRGDQEERMRESPCVCISVSVCLMLGPESVGAARP